MIPNTLKAIEEKIEAINVLRDGLASLVARLKPIMKIKDNDNSKENAA